MSRKILIAGDSTVTNRESTRFTESHCCYTGWGQMLPILTGTKYMVKNFAKSGLATDTFIEEGIYADLMSQVNTNDYVIFQFGHNDQKRPAVSFNGGYRKNLLNFIAEVKSKNAVPILITPLGRNSWNGSSGEYNDLLFEYANVVREVALETNTYLIDLHKTSIEWIISEGREKVKEYFYPGDFTHTNDHGAFKVASFVYEQLKDIITPIDRKTIWTDLCPSRMPQFLYELSDKKLTRLEALRTVRELCAFFPKNEIVPTNDDPEIISARQNGYLLFDDCIEDFISEEDFVKLLKLATSAREIIPNDLYKNNIEYSQTITATKAIEYIEIFEDRLNYNKNEVKPEIAGS